MDFVLHKFMRNHINNISNKKNRSKHILFKKYIIISQIRYLKKLHLLGSLTTLIFKLPKLESESRNCGLIIL